MIDMNKKYRYRSGAPARVLCVDRPVPHSSVLAMSESGAISYHTPDGVVWDQEHGFDLIEVSPWDDFEVDEPVMVRHGGGFCWTHRHFAGVCEGGRAATWADGLTSWTASNIITTWDECRRPTPEELRDKV